MLLIPRISVALGAAHLEGLDRLYFEHVGGSRDSTRVPPFVARFLPEAASPVLSGRTRINHRVDESVRVEVRDFHLPLQGVPGDVFLRQIIANTTMRISELWWALYSDGQRGDVWYFKADPARNDNKALSNYEIEAATASTEGGLDLQVRGEMFRPQGAWWIVRKVFSFSSRHQTLALVRVRNTFGFFHDYELDDSPPRTDVRTEREMNGRFESLIYDAVPDDVLRACRFRDPESEEGGEFSWEEAQKTAICITEKPAARSSHRGLDEPSFAERGGGSQ
jgi:hypothetical protein